MFSKPKYKSKSKTKRNPMPTENSICEKCWEEGKITPYAETHEIFYGTGQRQLSIEYGIQALLCAEHHRGPNGPHHNRERDLELKRRGQKSFEQWHGHEKFMELFGRNYLDD